MKRYLPALMVIAMVLCGQQKPPAKPGVKTPGVQIPIAALKPEAVFEVPGTPDWIAVGDAVWISNKPKNSVARIDPKTNKVAETITVGKAPCSGLAIGFDSLWVPNCGDHTVSRVDLKTNKVTATFPIGIADSEGGLAASPDSVWLLTDKKGTLARIDPATNKVVAEIYVAPGSFMAAYGEDAIWVTSTREKSGEPRGSEYEPGYRQHPGGQSAEVPRNRRRRGLDTESNRRHCHAHRSQNQEGGRDRRSGRAGRRRRHRGRRRIGMGDLLRISHSRESIPPATKWSNNS